mgnify:CR=1 FL=1|tara:strand:- start:20582 stop:20752 length:171 start_codon:yes stop_codon:yes gene_type:complete
MTLKDKIQKEIERLSSDHSEETINLINNVLLPMLQYIRDHEKILRDIARISGKHGV